MAGESDNPRTEDQTNTKNPNPSEEEELEEGEIVGDDEPSKNSTAVMQQPHPLEHSWTFWFDNPFAKSKQATWGSSMRSIYTFSSVEEFWSLYNNIHHPSKLAVGADFYCFKNKIEPKWEDPVCANGGKWTVIFPKGKSDTSWLYTMSIGKQWKELLDYSDTIGFIFHVWICCYYFCPLLMFALNCAA
ncbi:hypothetical protein CICLE_v10016586mg [Citrus x clementina]|uniref:Eukaryotic translation initiation factor 4E-1 n=1 Tax=Citrus clementina TaxID=85681 RepID=V4TQN0_CITCL|nr:hypothetical protein CICLE_v10016586mg [Citrus x clementina]